MDLTCVSCGRTLQATTIDGVSIDTCPFGHGAWVEPGEFDQLVANNVPTPDSTKRLLAESATNDNPARDLMAKERPCVVCSEPMQMFVHAEWSGIVVDTCAQHGTWFDTGEIERAVAWDRARTSDVSEVNDAHVSALSLQRTARAETAAPSFLQRLLDLLRRPL